MCLLLRRLCLCASTYLHWIDLKKCKIHVWTEHKDLPRAYDTILHAHKALELRWQTPRRKCSHSRVFRAAYFKTSVQVHQCGRPGFAQAEAAEHSTSRAGVSAGPARVLLHKMGLPRYCCSTAFGQLQGKKMRTSLIKEIKLPCMGWFSPQIRSGSHRSVDLWDPQGNVLVSTAQVSFLCNTQSLTCNDFRVFLPVLSRMQGGPIRAGRLLRCFWSPGSCEGTAALPAPARPPRGRFGAVGRSRIGATHGQAHKTGSSPGKQRSFSHLHFPPC